MALSVRTDLYMDNLRCGLIWLVMGGGSGLLYVTTALFAQVTQITRDNADNNPDNNDECTADHGNI